MSSLDETEKGDARFATSINMSETDRQHIVVNMFADHFASQGADLHHISVGVVDSVLCDEKLIVGILLAYGRMLAAYPSCREMLGELTKDDVPKNRFLKHASDQHNWHWTGKTWRCRSCLY